MTLEMATGAIQLLLIAAAFFACSTTALPVRQIRRETTDDFQEQSMRISLEVFQAAAVSIVAIILVETCILLTFHVKLDHHVFV